MASNWIRRVKLPLPNLLKLLEEGSELPVFVNYAPKRKPGGYMYVFTFTEQLYANNWQKDNYLFRQDGTGKPVHKGENYTKIYYKLSDR